MKKTDTKTVTVTMVANYSSSKPPTMKITLPRLPWEPKEEMKEDAA